MSTHAVLIGLGANLPSRAGEPQDTIRAALAELVAGGIRIRRTSSFYRTPAWPDPADPDFVNAVASAETILSSRGLMDLLHKTETAFGRTRSARNAPRTLDLDLLDFDRLARVGPPELPHPRMASRAFVLVPLAEIAPHWRHPVLGHTAEELRAALPAGEVAAITRLR